MIEIYITKYKEAGVSYLNIFDGNSVKYYQIGRQIIWSPEVEKGIYFRHMTNGNFTKLLMFER